MIKPLLLIDIDGVISLFGFEADRQPAGRFEVVDGIAHFLSASAGEHLRELASTFELVWCSGWEDKANDYLPVALGLPGPLPHLTFAGSQNGSTRHWKLDAIDAYAGPRRPLAWVDDDQDARCRDWARTRPGPTLLVCTDPAVGLDAEHVAALLRWAQTLAASAYTGGRLSATSPQPPPASREPNT